MSFEYSTRVAVLAGALTLRRRPRAPGQAGRSAGLPESRSARRRAGRGPGLADDARREDLAADQRRGRHSPARGARLRVVERVPARRRARGRRDGVSLRRSGMAASFDVPLLHEVAGVISRRGAREAPRVRAARPARALSGPDVLVAQHQHLPRPALGARPGDLRRGPVPDRPHGRRVRHRPAGRRPALPEGRRDREALRRAQRTGGRSPSLRRPPERARPLRDVSARLPRARAGRARRVGDGRVQPRRRRVGLGQPAPADRHPPPRLGLRRLRRLRLRRHRRHLQESQDRRDARGRGGDGREERLRPRVRRRLPIARAGGGAGADRRDGHRRRGDAVDARTAPARHVRSARARQVRADSVLRERVARARPAVASHGAGVDGPAEERRRPAAVEEPEVGCRHRAERRRADVAARQLLRHAVASGDRAGRHPPGRRAGHGRAIRAGRRPDRGPAAIRARLPPSTPHICGRLRTAPSTGSRPSTSAAASFREPRSSHAWIRPSISAGTADRRRATSSRAARSPPITRSTTTTSRRDGRVRSSRPRRARTRSPLPETTGSGCSSTGSRSSTTGRRRRGRRRRRRR